MTKHKKGSPMRQTDDASSSAIMVVDDHLADVDRLSGILNNNGYRVDPHGESSCRSCQTFVEVPP